MGPRIARLANFAGALAGKHRESALNHAEAQDFLGDVRTENACALNWYFTIIIQAHTLAELEDRAAKVGTQMRLMGSGDVLEERANRVLAELSTLPGNGQYALRLNRLTSRQAGDLAMVYRLSAGDRPPFLVFGDRSCTCIETISNEMSTETGTYTKTAAGVLTETPTGGTASQTDYCVKGTTMTQSPHAGSTMMGQAESGTITLTKS